MNSRVTLSLVVTACFAYLGALTWAIANTTYDVWGVLVIVPPLGLAGALLMRSMFTGALQNIAIIMYVGLGVKLLGAALRYWVGFEAYEGGIDAQRYHEYAVIAATDVWAGRADLFAIIPSGTGTAKTEGLTALVYTLVGTSKMAGFVAFAFLGFVGTAFFVKAACIAIPGLAMRRYAALCVLAPSLAYWPSSIGKDALMMFLLGFATYGIARLVSQPSVGVPMVIVIVGLGGAAYIRPHMVGLWLAGAFPALLVALLRGRDPTGIRSSRPIEQAILVPILLVAAIGLVMVSLATVRYLDPGGDDESSGGSITSIIDETSRRTVQAGSAFEPPSIASPANWPYASIRTLTRPLLIEARGAAQLFVALELTIFLGLCALSIRRVLNVPKMVVTNPYMAFAMTTMFLSGLVFTSFANLAILARQKSIVVPFMLLIVCVPPLARRGDKGPERLAPERLPEDNWELQNSSMSPSVSAQLASGGAPRSFTARQVRTGPPPGSGTNDDLWD
jgi:hypothetical protein